MLKNIPNVKFSYNLEKDQENIKIGLETIRKGRLPDPELKKIVKLFGVNPSEKEILNYLEKWWRGRDNLKSLIIDQLQRYWDSIEEKFFKVLKEEMQLNSFYGVYKIDGFLSIRYGSGYSSKDNWFAVSAFNGTLANSRVAMHEIMHIFFNKRWIKYCEEQELSDKQIWDIREATTVLLNIWFKNELIDLDLGYPEHTELRRNVIREWWPRYKNFEKILKLMTDFIKNNPEKSPAWNK